MDRPRAVSSRSGGILYLAIQDCAELDRRSCSIPAKLRFHRSRSRSRSNGCRGRQHRASIQSGEARFAYTRVTRARAGTNRAQVRRRNIQPGYCKTYRVNRIKRRLDSPSTRSELACTVVEHRSMTMHDDFLHRIRAEPPAQFIASLKTRLNLSEKELLRRPPTRRRAFFIAGMMAGAALATGLFVSWTLYSPSSESTPPVSEAVPSPVGDQHRGLAPRAADPTAPAAAIAPQGKAAGANRTTGQFGVAATIAIYPAIKEATRLMNRNMNVYPPFPEPALTMMSSDAVFPSLCDRNLVDAVVVDRRIPPEELEACHRTNKHIAEVKLGHEAVVLARSNLYDAPKLSTRAIFLALAREIPNPLHPDEL